MMDPCCGVARPQQGPSSASICTHCHVILPFRTHCHFILPNTGPSPGTFTLIGTDLRPWRCHFMLQVAAILCFKSQRTAATRKSFRYALRRQFLALNHRLAESSNSNCNETD